MKLRQMLGNRTINYDKYANGIYILHTNGLLFKRDKWNLPNDEAVGVAVISDNCKFVNNMSLKMERTVTWGLPENGMKFYTICQK